ncbi:MAG TPA: hypothetical protein VFM72_09150 [Aequorivita sp.]|nr:hypothetical protein [Aequorivita sp.]
MKTNFYIVLIVSILLLFSCSNDDDTSTNGIRQNSCDLDTQNRKYTECCVEGPLTAQTESIFFATYTTNISSPLYSWQVLGGSIEIIDGGNSATAKFKTKSDFVRDTIVGQSYSISGMSGCSDLIVITSGNN